MHGYAVLPRFTLVRPHVDFAENPYDSSPRQRFNRDGGYPQQLENFSCGCFEEIAHFNCAGSLPRSLANRLGFLEYLSPFEYIFRHRPFGLRRLDLVDLDIDRPQSTQRGENCFGPRIFAFDFSGP